MNTTFAQVDLNWLMEQTIQALLESLTTETESL